MGKGAAGIAGTVSLVAFIASFAAYGTPPSVDATPAELAAYVADTARSRWGTCSA